MKAWSSFLDDLRQQLRKSFVHGAFLRLSEEEKQEGKRCKTVELGAGLFQVANLGLDLFSGVLEAALDRGLGHAQFICDLLDGQLIVIEQCDTSPLVIRKRIQDLADESGGLFAIHDGFRQVLRTVVLELRLFTIFFVRQTGETERLSLPQIIDGLVVGDPFDPGREFGRVLKLIKTAEGLDICVLQNIQSRIFVLYQELHGVVDRVGGPVVKIRQSVLVAFPGSVD